MATSKHIAKPKAIQRSRNVCVLGFIKAKLYSCSLISPRRLRAPELFAVGKLVRGTYMTIFNAQYPYNQEMLESGFLALEYLEFAPVVPVSILPDMPLNYNH